MGVTTTRDTRDIDPISSEKPRNNLGLPLEEFTSLFTGDTSRTRDMSSVRGAELCSEALPRFWNWGDVFLVKGWKTNLFFL